MVLSDTKRTLELSVPGIVILAMEERARPTEICELFTRCSSYKDYKKWAPSHVI